jgi:hypothetical protein
MNSVQIILDWNSEDDLLNRTYKAFHHLLALQKPKEAF